MLDGRELRVQMARYGRPTSPQTRRGGRDGGRRDGNRRGGRYRAGSRDRDRRRSRSYSRGRRSASRSRSRSVSKYSNVARSEYAVNNKFDKSINVPIVISSGKSSRGRSESPLKKESLSRSRSKGRSVSRSISRSRSRD